MPEETVLCSGSIDRIGFDDSKYTFKYNNETFVTIQKISNHSIGLKMIAETLLDKRQKIINSPNDIDIVGHRVVHGGKHFNKTTEITLEVKNKIKSLAALAPLHNPANLEGILVAEKTFPKAKQIAVFDTAFHQTIPKHAYKYAIPNNYLDTYNIRLYGFHGTSHKYVSEKAISYLGIKDSKIITIHLGNGCSMTAVKNGKSIDHSLGFSPITGLIMGTRSGDIDPSIIFYMANKLNLKLEDINDILQKKSGMLGLTGYSDLREIEAKASDGDKHSQLALQMNAYRIKKYIGSYTAIMNGLDAIVFTAGIGENSPSMRARVCEEMDYLGITIDLEKNNIKPSKTTLISNDNERVKVLVIPTNEELEIAEQAYNLFEN